MIYFRLFFEFFKIGLFTFGGGYAMVPLIEDTVLKYSWMTEDTFYEFIGICESTPGPIGVNIATYVGNTQAGVLGGIIATIGVVLPSFFAIILILTLLKNITKNMYFKGFLKGVSPIIIALILFAGLELLLKSLGYQSIKSFDFDYKPLIILFILFIVSYLYHLIFKKKCSALIIIIASAVLGIIIGII